MADLNQETKTIKEKLENFWYYYKNYVIAVLFFSVIAFTYFYDTIFEPDSDGTITIVAQPYFYDATDYMSETWSKFAVDLTGDGKAYIKIIPIQSDPYGDFGMDSSVYQAAAITVTSHIKTANNFLYILDEVNYSILKEQGVQFVDLSDYSTNLDYDNEMYSLKGTALADSLGFSVFDLLYFALIEKQIDSEKTLEYEHDLELLKTLINYG